MDQKYIDRFYSRVEKSEGCWEWKGGYYPKKPYGYFSYKSQNRPAHRISWMISGGNIPDGLCVCHKCDNPKCVNPEHLFLGTNRQNTEDRHRKGRDARGEKCPKAKLKEGDIYRIREIYRLRLLNTIEIGKAFGVSKQTVRTIIQNRSWKHLK